jgi:hypothetical protein
METEAAGIKALFNSVESPQEERLDNYEKPAEEGKDGKEEFVKVTFYIRPDQLAELENYQLVERKRTGKRPSKMVLVREALDLWIEKNCKK